ncbi:CamS family sex pheromone protein [Bacillus manliponensis]|uniref:CamS family sex pheromone protein n=1 Tax=Bacillus manliponensis TaxID=574376 RepID=UPI0035159C8C
MLKKVTAFFICLSIILSGCSGNFGKKQEEVVQEHDEKEKKIISKYAISDEYYRTIIPLKEQKIIGEINEATGSKLDLNAFEMGLMDIAKDTFNTKDHFLQRSEYLPQKKIEDLLLKQYVISNVIEHDYFKREERSDNLTLGGVVIGLSVTANYSHEEATSKGKEVASQILKVLREKEETASVPVVFALFKQETQTSLQTGSFIGSMMIEEGQQTIGEWGTTSKQSFNYPSPEFEGDAAYSKDVEMLQKFTEEVKKFNKDYIPVNGEIFYENGQLDHINLNVRVQFYGKSEVIALSQVVTQHVLEIFPKEISVQVNVNSEQKQEAVIMKEKNTEKPFVHFLD